MLINADFSQRVSMHAATLDWRPSPIAGVDRKMLDRIGEEVARATSIVRYAAGSRFAPHTHGGGEEFLVIDGVFQDEHGDYPTGTYVRNPPGSSHAPGSRTGCTIFVKLWQFSPADRQHLRLATDPAELQSVADRPGASAATLFRDNREEVRIERWEAGAQISLQPTGGIELFCLDGSFSDNGETFGPQSWLRLPMDTRLDAIAGADGCRVWVKEGHLRFVDASR